MLLSITLCFVLRKHASYCGKKTNFDIHVHACSLQGEGSSLQLITMNSKIATAAAAVTAATPAIICWLSSVDEMVQLVTK